jgi:hypothetical protein
MMLVWISIFALLHQCALAHLSAAYIAWSSSPYALNNKEKSLYTLPQQLLKPQPDWIVVLQVPKLSAIRVAKLSASYANREISVSDDVNFPLQEWKNRVLNAKYKISGSVMQQQSTPKQLFENGAVDFGLVKKNQIFNVEDADHLIEFLEGNTEGKSLVSVNFRDIEQFSKFDFDRVEKLLGDLNVVYVVVGDYSDHSETLHYRTFDFKFSTLAEGSNVSNITDGKYGPQYVTSNIVIGLLASLFLILILFSALNCMMELHTPLRYPHKSLVIKKEF